MNSIYHLLKKHKNFIKEFIKFVEREMKKNTVTDKKEQKIETKGRQRVQRVQRGKREQGGGLLRQGRKIFREVCS